MLFRSLIATTLILLWTACPASTLYAVTEIYPPYEYLQDQKPQGIDIEILNEIGRQLGVQIEFSFRPWSRALFEAKIGQADFIFPVFRTPEREQYLSFTRWPISYERNVLVVPDNSPLQVSTWNELANLRIGVVTNYSYGQRFDNDNSFQRFDVRSNEVLLSMLLGEGRIDAAVINEMVFHELVMSQKINTRFRVLSLEINNDPLYIGFSRATLRKSSTWKSEFDRVLEHLHSTGYIQQKMEKYRHRSLK